MAIIGVALEGLQFNVLPLVAPAQESPGPCANSRMIFGGDGGARPVTGLVRKWTSQVDVTRSLMMPLLSGHRTMSRGRSDAAMMGVRWCRACSD